MNRIKAFLVGAMILWLWALFCSQDAEAEQTPWDCPDCGRTGITRNYCGGCGHPAPWVEENSGKLLWDEFKKVGSIVKFGHYEQDNNLNNGPEEIEWVVLDVQEGKSLLLSKYGLDVEPYHTFLEVITWEGCSLRDWLNNVFLKAAFASEEQTAILVTTVDNSSEQNKGYYGTSGGNNTQDQVFLLSYQEVYNMYLKSDNSRKCIPTKYAEANGAYMSNTVKVEGHSTGWWWLRSPGDHLSSALRVLDDGLCGSSSVIHIRDCVRPAFWINLESEIFLSENEER